MLEYALVLIVILKFTSYYKEFYFILITTCVLIDRINNIIGYINQSDEIIFWAITERNLTFF